jgi:hypothetical protein
MEKEIKEDPEVLVIKRGKKTTKKFLKNLRKRKITKL